MTEATADNLTYLEPPAWIGKLFRAIWQFVMGLAMALLLDGAAVLISLLLRVPPFVFGILFWVSAVAWLVLFRKRYVMAVGVCVGVPIWPFVIYAVAMTAMGITC